MGIVKRANGSYEAQLYYKRKMVWSKRCGSEREAKKAYLEKLSNFRPNSHDHTKRTFDELLLKYTNEVLKVENRANTIVRYELDIRERIEPYFCYRRLSDITPDLISQFRSELIQSGKIMPKSINMCLSVLSAILKCAVEWEWLPRSPYKLKPLQIAPRNHEDWWQTRGQIDDFLQKAKLFPRYYLAYRLAIECGIREGENLGLSPADIDLKRRSIHIWRQWVVKQHKHGPPKHNRERYVGWSENSDLGDLLAKRIAETTDKDILHSFEGPGHRISASSLADKFWYKTIKLAGVPEIRFHDCRHTFCSWYMLMGGNEDDLLALSGHKNRDSLRRYVHLKKGVRKIIDFGWDESRKADARQFPELKVVNIIND